MAHHPERHYSHRGGWLRASVLGANDGLLSTSALLVGIAAGGADRELLIATGMASLVAGASSMAAGEYGSVASQLDAERADLETETRELEDEPEKELEELVQLQIRKGLSPATARIVATELTANDALGAHARDELGLDPDALANPVQAAAASAASFAVGAAVPVVTAALIVGSAATMALAIVAIVGLMALGGVGGNLAGASPLRAAARITILGLIALAVTYVTGRIFGTNVV
jgi:VIT1/CCC1 family predicted Fe2+/Mn2+ transporter